MSTPPDWDYWQRVYDTLAEVASVLWLEAVERDANEHHAAQEVDAHITAARQAIEELRRIYIEPQD